MKRLRPLSTILIVTMVVSSLFSQSKRCHSDLKMKAIFEANPQYAEDVFNGPKSIKNKPVRRSVQEIITIPVHVIIVHPPGDDIGDGDNLSMEHIQSQITVLNEDFRRLNSDAANTPPDFDAADSEIEFCLATLDPDGNPTDGVTRYPTNQDFDNNEFDIKAATGWDRDFYLNVWVAPTIGALGYAYLPGTTWLPNPVLDGIAVRTGTFGGPGYAWTPNYDLGRTSTHEIGHYLGCQHVFAGNCNTDDGFDDTPVQSNPNWGCPDHPSPSCGNDGDMFMNYMDYVDDDCMNAFTEDQNEYMHLILNTSRSSLLTAAQDVCSGFIEVLAASVVDLEDALCFDEESGTATIEVTGGIPDYEYAINGGSFDTDNVFNNLGAGDYVVEVMDAAGTVIEVFFTIDQPDELVIEQLIIENVLCSGGTDGFAEFEALGGVGPYTYSIDGTNFDDANVFGNLESGNYTVWAADQNNCVSAFDFLISEPEELEIIFLDITNEGCLGQPGGVIIESDGGIGPHEFSIDGFDFTFSNVFQNLPADIYSAVVIDNNGCVTSQDFQIAEFIPIEVELDEAIQPDCAGGADGQITVLVTGGSGLYEYNINGGPYQDSPIFDNLSSGEYTFNILDASGCEETFAYTLNEPAPISADAINVTSVTCLGYTDGQISLTVSGGAPGYSFSLNGGEFSESNNFPDLSGGTYNIEILDINGCNLVLETSVPEPEGITFDWITVEPTCFGQTSGQINVIAEGGVGDLTYQLNEGPVQQTSNFDGLPAGDYDLLIEDASGCTVSEIILIEEPDPITSTWDVQEPILCFGDQTASIGIIIDGGSGPYMYDFNQNQFSSQGELVIENLGAGIFPSIIIDNNGCQLNDTIVISQPTVLGITLGQVTHVSCPGINDGKIAITGIGGTPPYDIFHPNGAEYSIKETIDIVDLATGIHIININDENGCGSSISVQIDEPEPLEVDKISITIDNGGGTGSVKPMIIGGTPPYQYSLDSIVFQSNSQFEELTAGDYVMYILDDNGCEMSFEFTIEESTTAIYNPALEKVVTFRPNPFNRYLEIETEGFINLEINLIVNGLGQIIPVSQLIRVNPNLVRIDIADAPAGVYWIRVKTDLGYLTRKVVKID